MQSKIKGFISLVLATVIWGGAFPAQSAGMDYIGPMTFQAVRSFLAVIALIAFTALTEIHNLGTYLKKWKNKQLWKTGLLCGLALFPATALQQIALTHTDAGKAGFLTAMYIVIVPLLGIFLHKKPSRNALLGVAIAVIGLYLLCSAGVGMINIYDIMLLGCAVAFAVQITLVDRLAGQLDTLRLNCIQALVVALISTIWMLFTESPQMGTILDCWLPLCYAGILSMGAAYSLQIFGQKWVEPTAASMVMSLESVFAVLFGTIILKEQMSHYEILGCIFVFGAVILSQLPNNKKVECK